MLNAIKMEKKKPEMWLYADKKKIVIFLFANVRNYRVSPVGGGGDGARWVRKRMLRWKMKIE